MILIPEGQYYFVRECDNDEKFGYLKELSAEEWKALRIELEKLLIPDSDWHPALVFMPKREQIEYLVG